MTMSDTREAIRILDFYINDADHTGVERNYPDGTVEVGVRELRLVRAALSHAPKEVMPDAPKLQPDVTAPAVPTTAEAQPTGDPIVLAKLFHEKLGVPSNLSPSELTQIARKNLREKYITSEVGITGGNFLLADIGAVCVCENEGNGRLSTAFPKTHIAIVGIEKMLPSINDLQIFLPLLATYGTGQNVTVYNTIFTGPRQPGENDGPEEMYVILLDNGRTNRFTRRLPTRPSSSNGAR